MARSDLAARVHDAPPALRAAIVASLTLLVGLVSWWSIEFRPPNAVIAFWWPAAALGATVVIMARRRGLATLGVFTAVVLANAAVGRPLDLDLGYGLANAATAWTVARIATGGRAYATIRSVRSAGRFLVAVAAGAAVVAVLGAASATLFAGADFLASIMALYPSHASALLVLTPLALVEWRWRSVGRTVEAILQVCAFAAVLIAAYWPDVPLPLGFTTVAVLLWAAFRLPFAQVALQLATLGIVATTVTAFGWGSYAELVPGEPRLDVIVVQLYLIVHACVGLLVAASRVEWGEVSAELAAREGILRSGLLNIDAGVVIGEVTPGHVLRILEVTPAADRLLVGAQLEREQRRALIGDHPIVGIPALDDAIRALRPTRLELDLAERGRFDTELNLHVGPTGTQILTIVLTDVTARVAREREALATAEQLRDLNRQKDAFIASVSHELRTPVTAILGFVEDLAEGALPDTERVAATIIDRNARRLAAVIDDVLELSRLTGGTAAPRTRVELDVATLVRMACDDAGGLAPAGSVRFETRIPDAPVMATLNGLDLERVVANLLSNAVKFSPTPGTISVTLSESDTDIELRVADEGPGIPPAELERVWERFYRVQDSTHREVPGTGLGLPIVRALVERRLGGTVRLESDGVRGTTAVVTLPRVAPEEPLATQPIAVVDQEAGA